MFTLYTRSEIPTKSKSKTADIHLGFHQHGKFPTYKLAVLEGQEVAGYGGFYIDTNERSPSREEQLLEEPKPRRYRNAGLRNAALLED